MATGEESETQTLLAVAPLAPADDSDEMWVSPRAGHHRLPPAAPVVTPTRLVKGLQQAHGAVTSDNDGGSLKTQVSAAAQRASSRRRLHIALALHGAMASRWLLLPVAALWSSGSLDVSLRLAGCFGVWSLVALAGDVLIGSHGACAMEHTARASPCARSGVIAACSAVPVIAAAVLFRAPFCLPPGTLTFVHADTVICAGELVIILFFLWGLVFVLCGLCLCNGRPSWRDRVVGALSVAWVVGEGLVGLAAGVGLHVVGLNMLLRSDWGGGSVDGEWRWLFALGVTIHLMSWVAAAAATTTLFLMARRPRGPAAVGGGLQLEVDAVDRMVGGIKQLCVSATAARQHSHSPPVTLALVVAMAVYVLCLLICGVWWVAGQV